MFVHLHLHSQYSILDATASVEAIAQKTAALGMPAVALTDHGNMYGAVEFFKACKSVKVKPIIGCEVYVAPESRLDRKKNAEGRSAYHLTLLAKNDEGYHNLCRLTSMGFLEGFYYHPRIDLELLKKYSKGLICLSGCLSSEVSQTLLNHGKAKAEERILWYRELFGEDYYLEIQRHTMRPEDIQADGMTRETWLMQQYQDYISKQNSTREAMIEFSSKHSIPLVATNDTHYIDREDWRAHEILLNVQSGEPCEILERDSLGNPKFRTPNPKRRTYSTHECYLKSADEMQALFADRPEAIMNTLLIADKCSLELDFKSKHYPVYVPPQLENKPYTKEEQQEAAKSYLWQLCEEGIPRRYTPERLAKVQEHFPGKDPMEVVRDRLKWEMSIIVPKGMCDYLLIVWDFIHWAKKQGIPVGPGRGSGAGSIVLYLIGVTDIEPLRFHLFFERFINPERISYPDIDVDICMDRRGEVINYTLNKYGKDNVAQIITFGTMKARMSIKDVGRVLSVPLPKVNDIAKLVPEDLNITLEKALEKDPDLRALYESDEEAKRVIDIGRKLEGSIRNTGIHAAGIVVSGEPLTDHIPVCNAKDSDMPATQYSMKPVELVGMLKIDFLGLTTLTCIMISIKAIEERHGVKIDWMNLPLDDKATYDLLNQGKTMGIFQLESGGMQELAKQLHLDKFEEIIAVGALYRPGPMDMIPSFINRKHGREPIENDHPWMQEILAETYGIMVYQEQVMQIASKLAGYSLGEGDVLRRAMGKKDAQEMSKQREKFRQGCIDSGVGEDKAKLIFDKMEKFASYGFNKSHAAAYAYLTYVTAYLKANYPKEWMAALMTCVLGDISKVSKFIRECKAMGIAVLPPDVNDSSSTFAATDVGIRFAISAIRGVGQGVVEAIVAERDRGGRFSSLYDFIKRVDTRKVGKKVVESLVEAGSFDFTSWSRDALKLSVEPIYDAVSKDQKDASQGFMNLFAALGDANEKRFTTAPEVKRPTPKLDLLLKEKELLGFFLTGHPTDAYKPLMQRLSCVALSRVEEMSHDTVFRSALIVESIGTRISNKSQKKFAILTVSDGMVNFELPIWPEMYEEKGHLLKENQLLYAVLQLDKQNEEIKLQCRWFDDLTRASEEMMSECDAQFDKAKQMAERAAYARKKSEQAPKKKEEKLVAASSQTKKSVLNVQIDAEKCRHSQILALKDLFEKKRGETSVEIQFNIQGRGPASLHIAPPWGINFSPELEKELRNISSVIAWSCG